MSHTFPHSTLLRKIITKALVLSDETRVVFGRIAQTRIPSSPPSLSSPLMYVRINSKRSEVEKKSSQNHDMIANGSFHVIDTISHDPTVWRCAGTRGREKNNAGSNGGQPAEFPTFLLTRAATAPYSLSLANSIPQSSVELRLHLCGESSTHQAGNAEHTGCSREEEAMQYIKASGP